MASLQFCDGCGFSAPMSDLRYVLVADKDMRTDFSVWYCATCVDALRVKKQKFEADLKDCKLWRAK